MTARRSRSAAQRFDRRQASGRRRRLVRAAVAVLVTAGVAGLVWLFAVSQAFAVRSVTVVGVAGPERSAIAAIARGSLGTPLARVDTGAIAAAVRRRRAVAEVQVARSWPTGLTVTVLLRTPVLVLRDPNGELEVVDRQGVVFGTVTRAPAGVPTVSGADVASTSPDIVRAALAVVRALPTDMLRTVTGITVTKAGVVSFTSGTTTVVWGTPGQEALKLRVVRALLATHPHLLDVSAPDMPVTG